MHNITFDKLQQKYNIIFNTLVIDCEGCYEELLVEGFKNNIFKDIKKIIIEWDGKNYEQLLLDNNFSFISYLPHINLVNGVRVYWRQ
jgi:hypothetical protein